MENGKKSERKNGENRTSVTEVDEEKIAKRKCQGHIPNQDGFFSDYAQPRMRAPSHN